MHNYKIGDKVKHPCDSDYFEVVGIRKNEIEIKGDWSGGTHNTNQTDWCSPNDVEPYDKTKVVYYVDGVPYKNGEQL